MELGLLLLHFRLPRYIISDRQGQGVGGAQLRWCGSTRLPHVSHRKHLAYIGGRSGGEVTNQDRLSMTRQNGQWCSFFLRSCLTNNEKVYERLKCYTPWQCFKLTRETSLWPVSFTLAIHTLYINALQVWMSCICQHKYKKVFSRIIAIPLWHPYINTE